MTRRQLSLRGKNYNDHIILFEKLETFATSKSDKPLALADEVGTKMLIKMIDGLSRRAFNKVKWLLTAMSGLLTSGFIIILES